MYYLILIILILVCLSVILLILFSKLKRIKQEEIKISNKEKQDEIKRKLIEARLEKKFFALAHSGVAFLNSWGNKVKTVYNVFKHWDTKLLKNKYNFKKNRIRQIRFKENDIQARKIEAHLGEARILLRQRRWDEAEDTLIKVLELDHKNIEAYMGLGKIYIKRRELDTAEEAFRYIVKIDKKFVEGYKELIKVFELSKKWLALKDLAEEILSLGYDESWVYAALGLSYKRRGYPEKAEEYFKKAVETEPQNEKWLDYLLETCIINKNKNLALKAFNTLSQVCRDEIKLQGYRDKMDLL